MPERPAALRWRAAAILLAAWSATFVAPAAQPQAAGGARADPDGWQAVVDAVVQPAMKRYDIPGMAVGIIVDGRPRVFAYGLASRADARPVTPDTLFEIGSVSKTFTATLAGYAVSTGRLSLDDALGRHVPELRNSALGGIAVLNLGTYTAGGLPLQFPDEVDSEADAMAYLRAWKPLAAPGTRREYSNPSLGLFGRAAAGSLHESFSHAMQQTIFPAFGLSHTFLQVPARALGDYAWGYRGAKAVRVNPGPFDQETYGVKTSASDLLRFVQLNIDPSGLEPGMRRAVEATQVGYFRSGPLVQGLGWEQYEESASREWLLGGNSAEMIYEGQPAERLVPPVASGPRLFDKTGSTGGFGAYVAFAPSRRTGIVLLANRSWPIPARVEAAWTILQQLSPGSPTR